MKKGKEKIKRGISLIVLVITIIVIIILAAAVILTLNNNNPIVEANKARYESDVANMQAIFTNTVAKVMAQNQSTIKINGGSINTIKTVENGIYSVDGTVNYELDNPQKESNKSGTIVFDKEKNTETVYYTGKRLPLYKAGETIWYVDSEGIITLEVDKKTYGSGTKTEENAGDPVIPPTPEEPKDPDTLSDGTTKVGEKVTGEVKEYIDGKGNKAKIPIDFAVVPGKTSIEKGLVISDVENDTDDTGNQFVWVPVENMETFVREQGYEDGNFAVNVKFSNGSEPLDYNSTKASESEMQEYNKMKASVKEYHGFYIGRYEISNDGSDNAQSKKNKEPWVNIKWGNSMSDLNGGIVEKAREMYPEGQAIKGKVVSTLVYGVCWDETVRFIKKNYPEIEKYSSGYGNYAIENEDGSKKENAVKILTGSKEEYRLNNIYDIAGNVYEWTMEAYMYHRRVFRGGVCEITGKKLPISSRMHDVPNIGSDIIGGRLQLYIKQ